VMSDKLAATSITHAYVGIDERAAIVRAAEWLDPGALSLLRSESASRLPHGEEVHRGCHPGPASVSVFGFVGTLRGAEGSPAFR